MHDWNGVMSIYEDFVDLNSEAYVEAYDFDTCWTKTNPDKAYEILDVAVALIRAEGNLSVASRLLGRPRRSVEGFVLRQTLLRDLQEDLEAGFIDMVETLYKGAATKGDPIAQKFFLTTKGKNRGYVSRSEASGPDGGPIPVQIDRLDVSNLTSVELKALEKALMASPDASG